VRASVSHAPAGSRSSRAQGSSRSSPERPLVALALASRRSRDFSSTRHRAHFPCHRRDDAGRVASERSLRRRKSSSGVTATVFTVRPGTPPARRPVVLRAGVTRRRCVRAQSSRRATSLRSLALTTRARMSAAPGFKRASPRRPALRPSLVRDRTSADLVTRAPVLHRRSRDDQRSQSQREVHSPPASTAHGARRGVAVGERGRTARAAAPERKRRSATERAFLARGAPDRDAAILFCTSSILLLTTNAGDLVRSPTRRGRAERSARTPPRADFVRAGTRDQRAAPVASSSQPSSSAS
jgi:hypothetical protein